MSEIVSAIKLSGTECLLRPQVSLANLTSYRVGGEAQWYVEPKNWQELEATFDWFQKQQLELTLLGAGSNLLVSDSGISGLVLSTRHLRQYTYEDEGKITVGAGFPLPKLAWRMAKLGWSGLEWAVGIPGTVGGGVVMNAGAHSGAIADVLVEAIVVAPDGKMEKLTKEEFVYSYRTSKLQKEQKLVVEATFQLQPGYVPSEIWANTNEHLQKRKNSQPYNRPSCGSVFRNPKPHAAGWLIEKIGLKGYQIGGAQVAHRHANFIINCGGARAKDIFNLIHHVQEQVEYHWSVPLKPEVKLLGEFCG